MIVRAFLLLLLAAGLAAAATESGTASLARKAAGTTNWHEVNLASLDPGEEIEYHWNTLSDGMASFDVHWHDDREADPTKKIKFLIGPLDGKTSGEGKFTVPNTSNVSLFWENKATTGADVRISYKIDSVEAAEKSFLPAPLASVAAAALAAVALAARRR